MKDMLSKESYIDHQYETLLRNYGIAFSQAPGVQAVILIVTYFGTSLLKTMASL